MCFVVSRIFRQLRFGLAEPSSAQEYGLRDVNGETWLCRGEERLLQNLNERIRDVRQGPDGALWLLTDSSAGRILRVSPAGK